MSSCMSCMYSRMVQFQLISGCRTIACVCVVEDVCISIKILSYCRLQVLAFSKFLKLKMG